MIVQGQCGKVQPYTRGALHTSGAKGARPRPVKTKAGVKYAASQKALAEHLFFSWVSAHSPRSFERARSRFLLNQKARGKDSNPFDGMLPEERSSLILEPFRFGLAVCAPPVKSGDRKGLLPIKGGDYDNYTKAFLDAAQYCYLIPEDCLYWYRGPCIAQEAEPMVLRSGVYLADRWRMLWRFERASMVESLVHLPAVWRTKTLQENK